MNGNYEFNIIFGQEQFNNAVRGIVRDEIQNPTLPIKDPIDYELVVDRMDYSEVANCIYPRDIARHMDKQEVADHIEIDFSEVASNIDLNELAGRMDMHLDDLADQLTDDVVENLDYKKLAEALLDAIAARSKPTPTA